MWNLKNRKGLGEPMPLTDVQEYNIRLKNITRLGWSIFGYVVFMTGYIIYNNVVNNMLADIVRALGG